MKRHFFIILCLGALAGFSMERAASGQEPAAERRAMKYAPGTPKEALLWQQEVRTRILSLLKMDDLIAIRTSIALEPALLKSERLDDFTRQEWEIRSTPSRKGRAIKIALTVPHGPKPPYPAVVSIHGHGGSRSSVYDSSGIYKGFAEELAGKGYVTIACDGGQHRIYERGRTLMGERLWDLIRCVDFLHSLAYVDKGRIGCAGLSLGGEMAMWLGAMDQRIAAVVSAGFLTEMDQMEQNHCMCWKFDGLRELVDFADIYSMIAPRPLQCQNGIQEPETQFYVPLAKKAFREIQVIYKDFGILENAELDVHEGGHEIDLPALLQFFEKALKNP
ncbi:MAG: acetylxylan esterase [Candidatus Omnitrophica bacterium]|nr:acetylxylan esterase [Candidatus Omnitrophota bacterium]